MAKINKKWINLDRVNGGLIGTDISIDGTSDDNLKTYIDAQIAGGVQVHSDTVDPAVTDDLATYNIGDVWINTDTDESFRIVDNTDDAAVWIKTSLTADELSTDAFKTEVRATINIDSTAITNKYVDLPNIPYGGHIEVTPVGGLEQENNVDFEIKSDGTDDKRLSWDSKNLDGVLEDGDKLLVEYKYL